MTSLLERPTASALTGTTELARLILRRDRMRLAAWVVVMALIPAGVAGASNGAYPTAADRAGVAAQVAANPALLATRGPVFAPTPGGLVAQVIASSAMLLSAVVSLLLVVRYTRADEQAGRRELLGSTVVGRHAPLTAALAVVGLGNLAIALLTALLLVATGLPAGGSVALGLVLAAGGIVFAGVAALAAQVAEAAGAARGVALGALAALFAVSAAGEVSRSVLVWCTPFGWARRVQAYAGERWWVLLLFVALAAVVVAGSYALSARRDVGAGLVPPRLGPSTAAPSLRSPLALTWRLRRGSVLAWTIGFLSIGALLGAAMRSIGTLLDTPAFRELATTLGSGSDDRGVADVFFGFVLYVLAQVVAASAVAAALRTRTEETSGLVDALLSGPVGRERWAWASVAVAAAGTALTLVGLGLGAGLGYGTPLPILAATLAYLPACLVFAGLGFLLVGWLPRLAVPVTWTVLGLAIASDFLGEFRLVDRAVLVWVSPFAATGAGSWALVGTAALAVALTLAGVAGLRRRDLDAT